MKKNSKKYAAALKKYDSTKVYEIAEAAKLVKETSVTKFDSTVDLAFRLNVDPTLADQLIRGTISLPHGNGKTKKVLALTMTKAQEAKDAGADIVGGKEILEKIAKENWFDFDIIVATPDMMGELGKMGRVLGPKGLMPNPKTGTVSPDITKAIKEIKAGKIEYRVDKEGNIGVCVARVSFQDSDVIDNVKALVDVIIKSRPSSIKGVYIKNVVLHTTMGPAVHVTFDGRN